MGEICRKGLYLGQGYTVNDAESEGLLRGVETVCNLIQTGALPQDSVRIIGDSQLIIRFMLGVYKPRKASIYAKVAQIKELAKQFNLRPAYRHVLRALNTVPDSLCRMALEAGEDVVFRTPDIPAS